MRNIHWVLTLTALLATGPAHAGSFMGKITMPEGKGRGGSVNLYGKYNKPAKQPDQSVGVVALMSKSASGARPLGPAPVMDQKDLQFNPNVLPVQLGTEVWFTNSDSYYHNVFSLSQVKNFDLGRYPNGDKKAIAFDKPGVVPVFCDIHADMQAYIVVVDTPFFCTTDADGNFQIDHVPPGDYEVWVWRPGDSGVSMHSTATVSLEKKKTAPEVR